MQLLAEACRNAGEGLLRHCILRIVPQLRALNGKPAAMLHERAWPDPCSGCPVTVPAMIGRLAETYVCVPALRHEHQQGQQGVVDADPALYLPSTLLSKSRVCVL